MKHLRLLHEDLVRRNDPLQVVTEILMELSSSPKVVWDNLVTILEVVQADIDEESQK